VLLASRPRLLLLPSARLAVCRGQSDGHQSGAELCAAGGAARAARWAPLWGGAGSLGTCQARGGERSQPLLLMPHIRRDCGFTVPFFLRAAQTTTASGGTGRRWGTPWSTLSCGAGQMHL
jgi:hypothetical protein